MSLTLATMLYEYAYAELGDDLSLGEGTRSYSGTPEQRTTDGVGCRHPDISIVAGRLRD
jgi:hypothetical protein